MIRTFIKQSSRYLLGVTLILVASMAHAQFSITPTEATYPKEGGSGQARVTSQGAWGVFLDVDWIELSKTSGFGNEPINYTVLPNDGPTRIGTINASGAYLTITQEGTDPVPASIFLTAGDTVRLDDVFFYNTKLEYVYDGYYPFIWVFKSSEWYYVFEYEDYGESGWYIYDFAREQFGWTGTALYPWYFPISSDPNAPVVDFTAPVEP